MEHKKTPMLLSDAPVSLENDLIWENTEVGFELDMIAETILQSEEPLVFAVHGPWGAGKTSFLKMIEGKFVQQKQHTIHISWYVASTYQGVGDAATTLTLRLLRTLSDRTKEKESSEKLYENLLKPAVKSKNEMTGGYAFLQEIAGKVGMLADLGVVIEEFLDGTITSSKSKLVLMIDDLDRCSLDFIGDVLENVQRLNAVKNLFIFLAIDHIRLENALKKRFTDVMEERNPRWAAEKYIQHTIELPPLTTKSLTTFIRKALIPPEIEDKEVFRHDPVVETIIKTADYFNVAIRQKLPRTIKTCMNLIRPALLRQLKRDPSLPEDEKRNIVKKQLIAYLFQDFYAWLQHAEKRHNSTEFYFLASLEELSQKFYADEKVSVDPDTNALFQFRLNRLKSSFLLEDQRLQIPEELAKLLARPPFLAYEDQTTLFRSGQIRRELRTLYKKAEKAYESDDERNYVSVAEQFYTLARANKTAVGNIGGEIGNLALNAQEFEGFELAEHLFRLALDIDPSHANNILNFVAFIVNNRTDLYHEARGLLEKLRQKYPEHRPERALRYLIRLKSKLGDSIEQELDELAQLGSKTSDSDERKYIFSIMMNERREFEVVQLFKLIAEDLRADKKALWKFQFKAALQLQEYASEKKEFEFIAMDLYRQLLTLPESQLPTSVRVIIMSMYAVSLQKYYYNSEAGCLLYHAYIVDPQNKGTQEIYSEYLKKAGADELLPKVSKGEALDMSKPILMSSSKTIPKQFSSLEIPNYFLNLGEEREPYICKAEQEKFSAKKTA